MGDFKVGDLVKCTDPNEGMYTNSIGTIESHHSQSDYGKLSTVILRENLPSYGEHRYSFYEDEMTLITGLERILLE